MQNKNGFIMVGVVALLLGGVFFVVKFIDRTETIEEQGYNIANIAETTDKGEFVYDTEYKVDEEVSKVRWTGYKVGGSHFGTVGIKEGVVYEKDGVFAGGRFVMDMAQIVVDDIEDLEQNKKLTNHLKNEDFFNVEKYPETTFELTQVLQEYGTNMYSVVGIMTIKDVTKEVGILAHIIKEGDKYIVDSKFALDRSLFNVRYGSETFFDNLGNKLIDNTMDFSLSLVLEKAE
jgi:polyisoprenoid-binding protein YceI